jgi:hypothetical protein
VSRRKFSIHDETPSSVGFQVGWYLKTFLDEDVGDEGSEGSGMGKGEQGRD